MTSVVEQSDDCNHLNSDLLKMLSGTLSSAASALTDTGSIVFLWVVLVVSAFIVGVMIANTVYFNRIYKSGGSSAIPQRNANIMQWLNGIFAAISGAVFIWSIFRIAQYYARARAITNAVARARGKSLPQTGGSLGDIELQPLPVRTTPQQTVVNTPLGPQVAVTQQPIIGYQAVPFSSLTPASQVVIANTAQPRITAVQPSVPVQPTVTTIVQQPAAMPLVQQPIQLPTQLPGTIVRSTQGQSIPISSSSLANVIGSAAAGQTLNLGNLGTQVAPSLTSIVAS